MIHFLMNTHELVATGLADWSLAFAELKVLSKAESNLLVTTGLNVRELSTLDEIVTYYLTNWAIPAPDL